jgi:hypothetical protein
VGGFWSTWTKGSKARMGKSGAIRAQVAALSHSGPAGGLTAASACIFPGEGGSLGASPCDTIVDASGKHSWQAARNAGRAGKLPVWSAGSAHPASRTVGRVGVAPTGTPPGSDVCSRGAPTSSTFPPLRLQQPPAHQASLAATQSDMSPSRGGAVTAAWTRLWSEWWWG